MSREDLELYVTGNFDGDVAALERAIGDDPALAEAVADEARFESVLRDAMTAAVFCPACEDVVRAERCETCGAAARPGGYVVERVLVSNAHGRMYVAHDADGKRVALKELAFVQSPSASTIEAFEREAKFLRALEHPAIPRFVASFEEGRGVHTRYYLAQELVEGKALDVLDEKWYSEAEIVDIARQVLAILGYLQSLSPMVIHRDIKPANLVRRPDGTIALVDFGAAYVHGSTAGVTTVGTFGYMPMEQLAGIVDATTDLYALGASLLYLLTRQEPWRLQQTKTVANVSGPLRAWLDRMCANDPRERFASAKEASAALEARDAVKQKPVRAPRNWKRPAVIAAALVAASGGGIAAYEHGRSEAFEYDGHERIDDISAATPAGMSKLRVSMDPKRTALLVIDGETVSTKATDGTVFPLTPGFHKITLVGADGAKCEQSIQFVADGLTTIECLLEPQATPPPRPKEVRLDITTPVKWAFSGKSLHDVVLTAAETCGMSVVLPGHIDAKITATLEAPCNEAFESILESQGLWYVYDAPSKLARIGPRRALEQEREDAAKRPPDTNPPLPSVPSTFVLTEKRMPLRPTLALLNIGKMAPERGGVKVGELETKGTLNMILPEHIDGNVTYRFHELPWDRAIEAVLASQGLWYRYRERGKIIRIAPRKQLDAEDTYDRGWDD
jgi:serine/threonine protein kinase